MQLKMRQICDHDYPALAPGAVTFMERVLGAMPSPVVAEWGCGRSTLWLASRAAKLVSVEHDPAWHRIVSGELAKRGAKHATVALADMASAEYPTGILSTGVSAFDLILIDGRRRADCATVARAAIKTGGYILVDNSNRPEYAEFMAALGKPVGTFTGHCTTTTVFQVG
jgi:hypothetical protein